MFPEPLFHILDVEINLYILFYAFGFVPALLLAIRLGREQSIPLQDVLPALVICIAAAFFGGPAIVGGLQTLFSIRLPAAWAPGMIVAVIVVLSLYIALFPAYRKRLPALLDIAAPAIALYIAIARLGCFSTGCCYGRPDKHLWWVVIFPTGHPMAGIPIHPTQLYESAGMLFILALLLGLRKVPSFKGALIWVFLAAYGLLRFVIEFYRGDPRAMLGTMSLNQAICLAFIAIGGGMMLLRYAVARRE
jgi:phosphatidylglycerol:prolipoprotein diacylglycerol transferase